jgi:hypothetical protein
MMQCRFCKEMSPCPVVDGHKLRCSVCQKVLIDLEEKFEHLELLMSIADEAVADQEFYRQLCDNPRGILMERGLSEDSIECLAWALVGDRPITLAT